MKNFIEKFIKPNALSLTLIVSYVVLVFLSNPFFKIPYDMWGMLMRIESIYYAGKDYTFFSAFPPGVKYHLWPWCWAQVFKFLNISEPFAWPYIIHVTQTIILSGSLFFFCWVAFSLLLPQNKHNFILAFTSMVFWLVGTGTFSVQYQQAWIMWYSVNYQCISMAILWLCSAFTLLLLYKQFSWKVKLPMSMLIIVFFIIGLFFHSMEMGFYLMFLTVISLFKVGQYVNIKKLDKKKLLIMIATVVSFFVIFLILYFLIKSSRAIYTPWNSTFSLIKSPFEFLKQILKYSWILMHGGNRFPNSFSEIAIFSLIVGLLIAWAMLSKHVSCKVNSNLFFALFVLVFLFFFIPILPVVDGVFALLTKTGVVYRFFYICPWFVFLPLGVYLFCDFYNTKKYFTMKLFVYNIIVFFLCLLVSKYLLYSALYGNVVSIVNSLDEKVDGCQYSKESIKRFKKLIKNAEKEQKSKKKAVFYIRGDWAPILACMPQKEVFAYNRLKVICPPNIDSARYYLKFEVVNIDLPPDFPRDELIFNAFPLLEKPDDLVLKIGHKGLNIYGNQLDSAVFQSFDGIRTIARIQAFFGNNSTQGATKDVILKIKENPNSPDSIAEVKVNAAEIKDNQCHTFKFPDYVHLDPKKTYYLVLESPESFPGNAVSVFLCENDQYKKGELFLNGKATGQDLYLKIWKGY